MYSTQASLVAPCVIAKGTLSITASEMYFDVEEEDEDFKKINASVSYLPILIFVCLSTCLSVFFVCLSVCLFFYPL